MLEVTRQKLAIPQEVSSTFMTRQCSVVSTQCPSDACASPWFGVAAEGMNDHGH